MVVVVHGGGGRTKRWGRGQEASELAHTPPFHNSSPPYPHFQWPSLVFPQDGCGERELPDDGAPSVSFTYNTSSGRKVARGGRSSRTDATHTHTPPHRPLLCLASRTHSYPRGNSTNLSTSPARATCWGSYRLTQAMAASERPDKRVSTARPREPARTGQHFRLLSLNEGGGI